MKKLRAAVIGPGWVAGEHIKGYVTDPRTELRAIVGVIPEDRAGAEKYMKQFNFSCDYVDGLDAFLKRDDIDVVSICTRNFYHYEPAKACIQKGIHTLVEKPLCLTQKENRDLLETARRAKKVKTQVGHVLRFYSAMVGLKNFRDEGGIGDVFYAECDYWHEILGAWKSNAKTGGSALLMGGCHAVDVVRWMIGEEHDVVEVSAMSVPAAWRKDFSYDPTIALIAKFSNGAVGRVGCSLECNMPYVLHLQVNGTKGTIRNRGIFSEMFPGSKEFMEVKSHYPDDWNVAGHPFPEEIRYFIDCIEKDEESMISIPRAYKTYELVFAAEEAARKHKVVKLPLK